ncbi:hypothetical protein QL285_033470 [Trifolium repens]|nr:hypothetical protein QL285_033470 [Trifolium repens]
MVEDFTDGLAKEVGSQVNNPLFVDRPDYSGPVLQPIRATFGVSMGSCDVSEEWVAENVVPCNVSEGQPSGGLEATRLTRVAKGSGMQRTRSFPPRVRRPAPSGPWSLEWLQDHRHGDARVIFSSRKRVHNLNCPGVSRQQAEHKGSKKRKGGGPLCHTLFSLKRIARLPSSDPREVLRILNKKVREEMDRGVVHWSREEPSRASDEADSSAASDTNDWKHWVALQGDERRVLDDVAKVGKSLGVFVKEDHVNRFSVLSKVGKGKQATPVSSTGGVGVTCKEV